ncbi:cob(I)yrinic acid a,c-diamide adenosyltransferase [Microbispora triticiradicis]|uniref:Corrinoid adenosyltransferase n=3 Tax=Microbispora TaxID=2005 RepID=A0ABY3LY46_9ACTN|nr:MULTISPECIES: cob(I)yrinic acid a,c-diamide adenosyltransferase [Microbispora]RGA01853.1 cob(I)yrinic acid a,c-diamide adenosyltransferase [Microbispora triticiradicis]TLP55625.1 cob(I)yrinic acid a,c-diamide adenosyltransferase [Microbispora fusca]TYB57968.1 cob(I)yrinic acid a,c-diamide adenosyltransferase [Microbispora tritici]GLW24669.1 cob(I)yrinic acid a,c-diamide adenosyltransferase [Microbispora amethystogenes]
MTRADNDKPVVLSKIYTRTGDDGTTSLGDMSRTRKTDARLAAYADVEEANAAIGVALATGGLPQDVVAVLGRVQNELFDVGADLCNPVAEDPTQQEYAPLRVEESYIVWLEEQCDRFNATLKPLRSFILPGGAPATAFLHLARTVVRRAERMAWAALEAHDDVNPLTAKYLNRLSDLMFILCRVASAGDDVLWKPGATR